MIFNQTEKEERAYLMDIIALLAANIELGLSVPV